MEAEKLLLKYVDENQFAILVRVDAMQKDEEKREREKRNTKQHFHTHHFLKTTFSFVL